MISPHLDDAALSTAALIAARPGAVVVTTFAGRPPRRDVVTSWDAACGFRVGDDVVGARRREDRAAMHALGATPVWLPFPDDQYGGTPTVDEVARALHPIVVGVRPTMVAIPLGLFHSDHRLAHDASLILVARHPQLEWLAYEDVPYRRLGGLVDEAIARLTDAGVRPERARAEPDCAAVKRRAIACYRSQLRGLGTPGRLGHVDALAPERYWRLRP